LATVEEVEGDGTTAILALEIQAEEKATAEKVWKLLPTAASDAFFRVSSGNSDPALRTTATA
jgi:hypothetical protein